MRVEASFTRWGERASSTLSQSARYLEQAWERGRDGGREGWREGGRERGRERGRKGRREGGRERRREGEREGGRGEGRNTLYLIIHYKLHVFYGIHKSKHGKKVL